METSKQLIDRPEHAAGIDCFNKNWSAYDWKAISSMVNLC